MVIPDLDLFQVPFRTGRQRVHLDLAGGSVSGGGFEIVNGFDKAPPVVGVGLELVEQLPDLLGAEVLLVGPAVHAIIALDGGPADFVEEVLITGFDPADLEQGGGNQGAIAREKEQTGVLDHVADETGGQGLVRFDTAQPSIPLG